MKPTTSNTPSRSPRMIPTHTPCRVATVMADPLLDVVERLYAEVAAGLTLAEVLAVVGRCRTELDAPSAAALPELVERLARQRLSDLVAASAARSPDASSDGGGVTDIQSGRRR